MLCLEIPSERQPQRVNRWFQCVWEDYRKLYLCQCMDERCSFVMDHCRLNFLAVPTSFISLVTSHPWSSTGRQQIFSPELIFQLGSWDSWGKNQKRDPEHSLAFCRYVILPSVQGSAWFWLVIHVCVINGPIGQVLSGQVVLARAQVRVHLQSMGWRGRSLLSINFNSQIWYQVQ